MRVELTRAAPGGVSGVFPHRRLTVSLFFAFAPACLCALEAGSSAAPLEPAAKVLFDFSVPERERTWWPVNDDVMGGISRSAVKGSEGSLHFRGVLSLENNGGFASMRHRAAPHDLGAATSLVLRVKGDGRIYRMQLGTSAQFRRSRIAYQAEFTTRSGEWEEVRVALAAFAPTYRGRTLAGPPLDQAEIQEFGIMLADGKAGAFALEVAWIAVE